MKELFVFSASSPRKQEGDSGLFCTDGVSGSETNSVERSSQTVQTKVSGSQCFWLGIWPSKSSLCSVCNNSPNPYSCWKQVRSVTSHASEKLPKGHCAPVAAKLWSCSREGIRQTCSEMHCSPQPARCGPSPRPHDIQDEHFNVAETSLHQHCHCVSKIHTDSVSCIFSCDIWQPCQAPPLTNLVTLGTWCHLCFDNSNSVWFCES